MNPLSLPPRVRSPFTPTLLLGLFAALPPLFAQPDLSALADLDYRREGGGLENRLRAEIRAEGLDAGWREALLALATDPEANLEGRQLACRLLALGPDGSAAPALGALLLDPQMNDDARIVLARIDDPAADEALLAGLAGTTGQMQRGIIDTLARRGNVGAVPALVALVRTSPQEANVAAALRAIGAIGGPEAATFFAETPWPEGPGTAPLSEAFAMGLATVLSTPANALESARIRELSDRLRAPGIAPRFRAAGLRAALQLAPRDLDVILPLLASDDPAERALGATQLPLLAKESAVMTSLVDAAMTLAPEAQVLVLSNLSGRGVALALPLARSALATGDPDLQAAALEAFAQLGEAADFDRLLALVDADEPIGPLAREALTFLPDPAANSLLMQAFAAADNEGKAVLVEIIAARGLRDEVGTLLAAADGVEYRLAAAVYKAIGDLGELDEIPVLLSRIASTERRERAAIERAVVGIGRRYPNGEVTDFLTARWNGANDELRTSLMRAIGAIGDEKALAFLLPFVDRPDPDPLALRFVTAWRDGSIFPLLNDLAQRPDWSESDRRAVWNAMLRLARTSLQSWAKDRMDQWEACYLAAPDEAGRLSMIDEVEDWPRVDMAEWLALRLDDPVLGTHIAEVRDELLRRLGED